jgi:hypothetical protein
MRKPKMPHVKFNAKRRRYEINRRVPREVRAIIGGSIFRDHKFPQHVSEEEANDQSVEIVRGWQREWDAIRQRPAERIRQWESWPCSFRLFAPDVAYRPGSAIPVSSIVEPHQTNPSPVVRKQFDYHEVLPLWKTWRKTRGKATSADDEKKALRNWIGCSGSLDTTTWARSTGLISTAMC